MRSDGNNYNYFPKNILTKMANFVQFIVCLCYVWRIGGWASWAPLGYVTGGRTSGRQTFERQRSMHLRRLGDKCRLINRCKNLKGILFLGTKLA